MSNNELSSAPDFSGRHTLAFSNFESNLDKLVHICSFLTYESESSRKIISQKLENIQTLIDNTVDEPINASMSNKEINIASKFNDVEKTLFKDLEKHMVVKEAARNSIYEWMAVITVTIVEVYLVDVLSYVASIDPTHMEKSEQSIFYSKLLQASSLEELVSEMQIKWAKNFINDGGPQHWINKLTKWGAREYQPETAQMMESLWGVRHLIVHSAGVATPDFVLRHPYFGTQIGEKIEVSLKKFSSWSNYAFNFVEVTDNYFVNRYGEKILSI